MRDANALYASVKQACDAAWGLAEDEGTDPEGTDPHYQDQEVERARTYLRPLLRELKLDDELRELDTAWETLGLDRKFAGPDDGGVTWYYCQILEVIKPIMLRVELRLSSSSEHHKSPASIPAQAPIPTARKSSPAQIRAALLKRFYDIYMDDPRASMSYGLDTFDSASEREVAWLIHKGWLDNPPTSLRLSVQGREEYERRNTSAQIASSAAGKTETTQMSDVRIFISHSSHDKHLARALVDVLDGSLRLRDTDIRCTSVPGYKLKIGKGQSEQLRRALQNCQYVIALVTPNSISAPWVMAELGACWGLGRDGVMLLRPDLSFDSVEGPLSGTHMVTIDDRSGLHQLVEQLAVDLGLEQRDRSRSADLIERLIQQANDDIRRLETEA